MKKKIEIVVIMLFISLLITSCGGSIESRIQGKWKLVGSKTPTESTMTPVSFDRTYYFKKGSFLDLGGDASTDNVDWSAARSYSFKDKRTIVLDGYAYRIYFKDGMMQMVDDNSSSGLSGTEWYYKRVK